MLLRRREMSRFWKPLALAVLATTLSINTPSQARAAMALFLQEDSGAIVQVATGASLSDLQVSGYFDGTTLSATQQSGSIDQVRFFGAITNNGATLSNI